MTVTRARRAPIAVLLCLAVAGALVLSASSTIHQAAASQVPAGAPQWAAVALLEVVSVLGTLLAVTRPDLRWRAMGAVGGAALVTLIAGWNSYGAMGLVAPLGLVYVVDLAAAAWRGPADVVREEPTELIRATSVPNEPGNQLSAPKAASAPAPARATTGVPAPSVPPKPRQTAELRAVPAAPADGLTSKQRLRARARALGITQSGKTDTQLRADCDAAERARDRAGVA